MRLSSFSNLIGTTKNGIRVFQREGKDGSKVLQSFKGNEKIPFKTIELTTKKIKDAYHNTGFSNTLNVEDTTARVYEQGKKPIEVFKTKDNWFHGEVFNKSFIRAGIVYDGEINQTVYREVYNPKMYGSNKNYTAIFDGQNIVKLRYDA